MSTPTAPDPESSGFLPAPGRDPMTMTPPKLEAATDAPARVDSHSPGDGPVSPP